MNLLATDLSHSPSSSSHPSDIHSSYEARSGSTGVNGSRAIRGTEEDSGGLGYLDPTKPILDLELVLRPPLLDRGGTNQGLEVRGKRGRGGALERVREKERKGKAGEGRGGEVVVCVRVVQDLKSLKGRKGDTG
jgi:hypothetical protein